MKIKTAFRYQAEDNKKAVLVYYLVVLVTFFGMYVLSLLVGNEGTMSGNNAFEMITAIFLFICGLCAFKESFGMAIQNGVSRKSLFVSRLAVMGAISGGLAVIDVLLSFVFGFLARFNDRFFYEAMFTLLYDRRIQEIGTVQKVFEMLLFNIALYLAASAVGYFITILYYRLNTAGKIAVSIGVPALFIIGPSVDFSLTGGTITQRVLDLIAYAMGGPNENVYITIGVAVAICALFSLCAWLLMRRAVVKDS